MNNGKKSSSLEEMELEYIEFLKIRIHRGGGSIPLTHLSGHLSQLRFELRDSFGTSPSQLTKLLRKHTSQFRINDKGIITLTEDSADIESQIQQQRSRRDSSCSSVKSDRSFDQSLPFNIKNGEGVIIRLFPTFGFMKVIKPANLSKSNISVYFSGANFNQKESILSKFDLHHQQVLGFDAVKGNNDYKSNYKATRVWIPSSHNKNEKTYRNSRKSQDTGLYDPMKLDGEGVIQRIFPKMGFIEVDGDPKNTVFFYINQLCKYENLTDLSKVVKKGDPVIFSAIRSTKNDAKARWEATQVWLKKGSTMRPSEENAKVESSISGSTLKESESKNSICNSNNKLSNIQGLLFASTNGVAIKFGPKFAELAQADSSLFYMYESKVLDILWEFENGQSVTFDAIREKSGWKAVLVWVGKKPKLELPACDEEELTDDEICDRDVINPWYNEVSKKPHHVKAETNNTKSKFVKEYDNSNFTQHQNDEKKSNQVKAETNNTKSKFVKEYTQAKSKNSAKFNKSIPVLNGRSLPGFNESLSSKSSCSLNSLNSNTQKVNSVSRSHSSRESSHTPTSEGSSISCRAQSRDSSQSSISSSKSLTTCNDLEWPNSQKENAKVFKEPINISNWGDTPYSDDEEIGYESKSKDLSTNVSSTSYLCLKTSNVSNSEVNKSNSLLNGIDDAAVDVPSSRDTSPVEKPSQNDNVDDNAILNFIKEKKKCFTEGHPDQIVDENVEEEDDGGKDLKTTTESKAYIKEFEGIQGTVQKIYSRFAEIESNKLTKPVAFFLNDFYRNGVSVDSHFDDLKEVLKSGDIVFFNCFEILDDDSNCWQKVTIVWKGKEPKIEKRLSPEKFIEEHGLKVTVAPKKPLSKSKNNSKEKLNNSKSKVCSSSRPKFLTENSRMDSENSKQCLQDFDIDKHQQVMLHTAMPELVENNITAKSRKWRQLNSVLNAGNMVADIANILERQGFEHSLSLDKACAEVIQYLLHNNSLLKKPKRSSSNRLCSEDDQSDLLKPLMVTTGVQTFVTGDVGSQNIYPH